MSISRRLGEWGAGLSAHDIPDDVRRAALHHLLDAIGVAVAARRAGDAQPAVDVASALGGPNEAGILGAAPSMSAPAAALATGALVHAWDFDDTHSGGLVHASAVVVPALLAVGQEQRSTGSELVAAAVAGYETVCRVGAASPHGFHAGGLHATSVCGVFSAALVAAKLGGADAGAIADALGIAGSSSAGLLAFLDDGSSTKQLHPGLASLNGVLAARLAAAGASGPAAVFEGPRGVYAGLSVRPAEPELIVEGLGSRWETLRIGYKAYPSCHLMHVTLDAARTVLDQIDRPDSVAEVLAYVHPDSAPTVSIPAESKVAPRTPYDAKFSLPWSVAALIVDGEVDASTYTHASVARPDVVAVSARVRSVLTDGAGPALDAEGRVEVTLTDGRQLVGTVAHTRGSIGAPLTDRVIVDKFIANCGDRPAAEELAARVLDLEAASSLEPVLDALRRIVEE